MRVPVDIHLKNEKFSVTVQAKNACKLGFAYHLWLPLHDQPQLDIVVFAIITFLIYNIIVTKWKHGIGNNDIIASNKELKFLSE